MTKVLIIDDSDFDRLMIRKVINAAARENPPDFTELPSGVGAAELVRTEQPDLIILDIRMPGLDGFDVLKVLRTDAVTRDLPVIMLSGSEEEKDRSLARENEATAYYVKPAKAADYFMLGQGIYQTYLAEGHV